MNKKTDLMVLSTNVVVLARFHNPSVLNPDFLRNNKIINKSWKETEVVTTQAFSQIKFQDKGVTIQAVPEQLQIKHEVLGDFPEKTPACNITKQYLRNLKHVNYTSVGLNWSAAFPKSGAEEWLVNRFIKSSKWAIKGESSLAGANITLKFKKDEVVYSFTLSSKIDLKISDKEPFEAVMIDVNAHHPGPYNMKEIVKVIDGWKEAQTFAQEQVERLLKGRVG